MTDAERALAAREDQTDRTLYMANQPATRGDIMALEKTIILSTRVIAETIMKARY